MGGLAVDAADAAMVLRATSSLVHQLRIVYADLAAAHPSADAWTPATASALQGFGCRYAAEMHLAALWEWRWRPAIGG